MIAEQTNNIRTVDAFNKKWKDYLEPRFYGLAIDDEDVIKYLDDEFTKEVQSNPNFNYSQIKTKFKFACVYAESDKTSEWELTIVDILKRNRPEMFNS